MTKMATLTYKRNDQKFLGLVYLGIPGMKYLLLFLNIISLHLKALSPWLFQFAYPFKIEVFILVPKYLFTASMTPSLLMKFLPRRLFFSFGNREKSERAKSGEYRGCGRTSKWHSVAAAIAICHIWAGALSYKSRMPLVNFPLLFLTISWRSRLSSSA